MTRAQIISGIVACISLLVGLFTPEIRHKLLGDGAAGQPATSWPKIIRAMALFIALSATLTFIGSRFGSIEEGGHRPQEIPPPTDTTTTETSTGTSAPPASATDVTSAPEPPPGADTFRFRNAEFVRIPAGTTQIGCVADCTGQELPAQSLAFRSLLMMKSEVTNAQYAECVAHGDCLWPEGVSPDWTARAKRPVVDLTALHAQDFCRFVGGRLPTESEWEYAAKSGVATNLYPWGATFDDEAVHAHEADVESFEANDWGLFDMEGNVAEWTVKDRGSLPGVVIRGGSFRSTPETLRTSYRVESDPHRSGEWIGFRCVSQPR